jgi:hypothetical protein
MTIDEVIQRIQAIKDNEDNYEVAHSLEDRLREDILKAIANGVDNAQELAQLALTTSDLDFSRWCA